MVRTRHQRTLTPSENKNENDVKNSAQRKEIKKEALGDITTASTNTTTGTFAFQGKNYETYEQMVQAKRKRNVEYLKSTGLLDISSKVKEEMYLDSHKKKSEASQRGLKADRKRKANSQVVVTRRKSNRVAGIRSDGMFIEDEQRGGKVVIGSANGEIASSNILSSSRIHVSQEEKQFFARRINDGSDISLKEAVELSGSKWVKENSVSLANDFVSQLKCCSLVEPHSSPRSTAATSSDVDRDVDYLKTQVDHLSVDDESCVAKVVPDRIYSIAFHPSPHKLIPVAGDKKGHIGFWDVDHSSNGNDRESVHLFKPHSSVISNLEWFKGGTKLFSASYDGSMRVFDVHQQNFAEVFATYDSSPEFKGKLGYNSHDGSWMQFSCIDHRNEDCIFYSTSYGDVVHLDLRQKGKITFQSDLSEKKINSISLHPSGNVFATSGLDCTVKIWDARKIKSSKQTPISTQRGSRSINSAFFSPSGRHLLTTTMSDTLDIITDAHLMKGSITSPSYRIRHNNQTGRWLSTFMAQWHPTSFSDMFVVGSMQQPRAMQIFDGSEGEIIRDVRGDALTAVLSRCCFHPSEEKLISAGGNSSGRVTVARSCS